MDLPSNLYHDSNCMGLVLYASFSIHGDPNLILSHLNSRKSHSLDCQCQMSMANVDDQTIAFGTTLTLPYTDHSRKKKKKKTQARDQQLQQEEDDKNHNKWKSNRSRKKKKKKTQARDQQLKQQEHDINHNIWKSEKQQQLYSSKLLQALSQVHLRPRPPSATSTATRRGRVVREAAERVLAMEAKGKTRWSSAIKQKFQKKHRKHQIVVRATGTSLSPKKPKVSVLRLKGKSLPAVQRKVRLLGRLVPGCRKQPLPVILEEATDYIAALEMQVKVMTTLADLLSGSTSSSSASSSYQDQGKHLEQSKQLEQKKQGSTRIAEVQEAISETLVA